jgi:DNA-binding IclR family transcriptional regulator
MNEPLAVLKDHGWVLPPKGCNPIRLDPIAQIYLALLANRADIDLNEIARITGVAGSELSWILAQLVQQNEVSRRKVRRGNESERVEYQLDRRQKERARVYLGAQISPAIALPWGDKTAALLRALLAGPHDKRRTVAELSTETGMSGAELAWRLATLHRDGVVCRSRTTSAGHGYFLDPDLAHRVATWLSAGEGADAPSADGLGDNSEVVRLREALAEAQRTNVRLAAERDQQQCIAENLAAELRQERARMHSILSEAQEYECVSSGAMSGADVESANLGRALFKAQPDPVALAAREAFFRRLLDRPALADLVQLKYARIDYQTALALARGSS